MQYPPQELIRRLERVLTPKEMEAWLEGWQQSLAAGAEPPPIPTWGLPSPSPNRNI